MSFPRLTNIDIEKENITGDSVRCYNLISDQPPKFNNVVEESSLNKLGLYIDDNGNISSGVPIQASSCSLTLTNNLTSFVNTQATIFTNLTDSATFLYNNLTSPENVNYSTGLITLAANKKYNIQINTTFASSSSGGNNFALDFFNVEGVFQYKEQKLYINPGGSLSSYSISLNFNLNIGSSNKTFYVRGTFDDATGGVVYGGKYTSINIIEID